MESVLNMIVQNVNKGLYLEHTSTKDINLSGTDERETRALISLGSIPKCECPGRSLPL